MQYLGGKSRLAKEIASVVAPKGLWWEPFCGGLSVSVQLAKYGPGIVSDVNPALIALYQAVRDGWTPPTSVSREEYEAAKKLPDSDPRKAFCGFGCSFGGKWFGGYADPSLGRMVRGRRTKREAARATACSIVRDVARLQHGSLRCLDFLTVDPRPGAYETIYCDPPYAGATGYGTRFSHALFWERCQQWAACGVRVFVSEYSCAVPARVAWQKRHEVCVQGGLRNDARLERLFLVLPTSAAKAA